MKILVLEDNENRNDCFKMMFNEADMDMAESAKEAISFLKRNKYDVVFLDHDLGYNPLTKEKTDDVLLPSGDGTGYEVAQFISQSENKNAVIIIHSFNVNGAKRMKDVLPKANYLPFWSDDFQVLAGYISKMIVERKELNGTIKS